MSIPEWLGLEMRDALVGILAAVNEDQPGGLMANAGGQVNPDQRDDGAFVKGVPLVAVETLYSQATVIAQKPGADDVSAPTANTGKVWLTLQPENMTGAIPLLNGQAVGLLPNGNLAGYYLVVDNDDDGVTFTYSTE